METHKAGTSFSKTFTVTNIGDGTLTGNISKKTSWISSVSPTSFSLGANLSLTITIKGVSPSNSGSFSDNIRVTSNGGTKNVYIHGIVGNQPVADFTANPTSGKAPLAVSFTDKSTNSPTSWAWDFGDGSTSSQQNPSHTYQNAGKYAVKLTATNQYGSNTMTKTDYIDVQSQKNSETNVALSPNGGVATAISEGTYLGTTHYAKLAIDGDSSTFWASEKSMPAWLKVEFKQIYTINRVGVWWNSHQHQFTIELSTDGNNWTTVVPSRLSKNSEGSKPVHELFSINSTEAKFIRINITSTSAPSAHIFQAAVGELEAYKSVRNEPQADFTASPTSGNAALPVKFTDKSTNGPTSWSWDFGDGDTSSQQNPNHTYQHVGTYTVSLTATNQYGSNKKTKDNYIQATDVGIHNNKIEKSIHIYPNPAKTKLYIQFKNTSLRSITISVYDLSGKLLYKNHYDNAPFEIIKLNLLNYKKGVYYIHFKTDKGILTKQFIVQ